MIFDDIWKWVVGHAKESVIASVVISAAGVVLTFTVGPAIGVPVLLAGISGGGVSGFAAIAAGNVRVDVEVRRLTQEIIRLQNEQADIVAQLRTANANALLAAARASAIETQRLGQEIERLATNLMRVQAEVRVKNARIAELERREVGDFPARPAFRR